MKISTTKNKKPKLTKAERAARREAALHLLAEARDGGSLIAVRRRFKASGKKAFTVRTTGFIVGLSTAWVLIEEIDDNTLRFNGYQAVRVRDVVRASRDTSFVGQWLRNRGNGPTPQPDILLADLSGLLSSVNSLFPLLTLETEQRDDSVCFIGRVEKLDDKQVTLAKIDPQAQWSAIERYPFEDITRVTFGDGYAQGLWEAGQDGWRKRSARSRWKA